MIDWRLIDDDSLGHAVRIIAALSDLLERERAVIQKLDAAALGVLADEKEVLLESLRELAGRAEEDEAAPVAVRNAVGRRADSALEVRLLATRLSAQARANVALLTDAADTICEALGQRRSTGTYDARARMAEAIAYFTKKAA